MLLTHRKLLRSKAIAIENDLRGTLRNFGLKVGMVGTVKFEARIKELIANLPDLAELIEPLLIARQVIREQFALSDYPLPQCLTPNGRLEKQTATQKGLWPMNGLYFKSTELDQYCPNCNAARDPLKPKLAHQQKSRSNMT